MKLKKGLTILVSLCLVFSMTLSVFATPDSYEPNNNFYSAANIDSFWYIPLSANIDNVNDVDYYYFEAKDSGYITIKITPPSGQTYGMTVLNQNLQSIVSSVDTGLGNPEYCQLPVTKGYIYYIVAGSNNSGYSDSPYTLSKDSFTSTPDAAYEVNNTPGSAAPINMYSGNPIIASISANTDVDYYVFTADSTGTLDIGLIGPYSKNYDIIVTDKLTGTTVGQSHLGAGQIDIASCSVVSGRQYYIIIYGVTSTDYYSGVFYQLYKAN